MGGWPDAIGEDIVLTWTMLALRRYRAYEPVALGFTAVPERLGALMSQRSRWARGMFEGLLAHPPLRQPRVLAKLVAGIDYLVPFLDIGIVFFWVPAYPVRLRLPLDRRLVVDTADPDHAGDLRIPAPMAGTPHLPPTRHPPPTRRTRLHRLPLHLPSPHLDRGATRLRPVHHRNGTPLEVTTHPAATRDTAQAASGGTALAQRSSSDGALRTSRSKAWTRTSSPRLGTSSSTTAKTRSTPPQQGGTHRTALLCWALRADRFRRERGTWDARARGQR